MKKPKFHIITSADYAKPRESILLKLTFTEKIKLLFGIDVWTKNYIQLISKKGLNAAEKLF